MTEREPNARDSTSVIEEDRKSANIAGKHILSNGLISYPQRIGDGYLISEDLRGTGNLFVAIIDISLGKSRPDRNYPTVNDNLRKVVRSGEVTGLMDKIEIHDPPSPESLQPVSLSGGIITESKMLDDLKGFLNTFITKSTDSASDPEYLLDIIRSHFNPTYFRTGGSLILWGYSLSAAYLDQQEKVITVASLGKNFVGKQSSGKEDEFISVFGDNSLFYSPQIPLKGVCAQVKVKTTKLPWGQPFIMATDGICERKRFPFPPKIVLQQMSDKELLDNNNEGLYLVIKPK